jgi:TrmH family RNA methyltransferase
MIKKITSRSNPELVSFLAEKEKFYLFEGEKLVKDILQKKAPVSLLVISSKRESEIEGLKQSADQLWLVNDSVLKKLSTLKEKSDFLAAVKIKPGKINLAGEKIIIAMDNIQDPLNAGTVFRCAMAFGITTILFSGNCVKPNNPKFIRAAQTSILDLKFQHFSNINELISRCQKQNIQVYLTTSKKNRKNTEITDINMPAMIIFGNEGQGLADDLFDRLPAIRIPQKDCIDSLNVGISACILMYELKNKFNL